MALVKIKRNNFVPRRQTILTKTLCRKYLLAASWLLMIVHIYIFWYAPDRNDAFIDDPSFGEPEIESSETRTEDDTTKDTIQRPMIEIEALQPVTFQKCCIPAAYKGIKPPNDHDCFGGTCYNERACNGNDTIYPFISVDEKNMFPQSQYTEDTKKVLRKECLNPNRLVPPVEWCQKPKMLEKDKNGTEVLHYILWMELHLWLLNGYN